MEKCVLCDEPLHLYPTNKEHYVPQVLIRNFRKLYINPESDWVVRQNNYTLLEDYMSVPITAHKKWAVVEVHEKCNLKAAAMCRDLKHIIDHIDGPIDHKYFVRPLEYYARLWRLSPNDLVFSIDNKQKVIDSWTKEFTVLYKPGQLNCGRIKISTNQKLNDYYHHTIYLGTKSK